MLENLCEKYHFFLAITRKTNSVFLAGAQTPWVKGLGQHVVNDPCSLRLLYQILLKLGERKLGCELVHGDDGAMPGEEADVGGGVVAQLD